MRSVVLTLVLISAATLGGCGDGVLNPKGPIAAAERQIMFNALGIMLAVAETRDIGTTLDPQSYADLAKPSEAVAPFTYRAVTPNLFDGIAALVGQIDDPIRRICLASRRVEQ